MAQQQNPQQNAAAETEQDINILKKIRMDKLAELQAAGNDPFTITSMMSLHTQQTSRQTMKQLKLA